MALVSTSTINFLENFLSEAEISVIVSDVNKLDVYFPLNDKKNPKNYLNILVNVFIKYRVESFSIADLTNQSLLSYGTDFSSQILSDGSSSHEIIEFNYKPKSDLTYLTDSKYKNFFQNIASSTNELEKVDILSIKSSDYILNELISSKNLTHDLGFANYFQLPFDEKSKGKTLPSKLASKIISDGIDKCLRYYAYDFIFKTWNHAYYTVYEKTFDLSKLAELKKGYFVLEWFFNDTHSKRNFFHVQTAYNFLEWNEFCKTGVFNTFDKPIAEKIRFNEIFVSKMGKLIAILQTKPFCKSSKCLENDFGILLKYFESENPLNDLSTIKSYEDILIYYAKLEELFKIFNMSFEAEKFRLQPNQLVELLINKFVLDTTEPEKIFNFPFKLFWKKNETIKSTVLYQNITKEIDSNFANFLFQFISSGVTKNDFSNYSKEINQLVSLQDKLTIIGDLPSNDKIDIPETISFDFKSKTATTEELIELAYIDSNVRKILARCKKFWYKIVAGNELYAHDPIFKDFFDVEEKKDTFAIIDQLEKYLLKWNEYKAKSNVIHQLEEEIEIVSKLKFNIEGLRLVSRKFSGAMSFIKGKSLMEKEKSRLIDAILKDLVGAQVSFHYNDGIQSNLDLIELSTSNTEKIVSSAIQIVEQTQNFKGQILLMLEPLPVVPTIESFIGYAKTLLGNTFKTIQITRFLENYDKWISRLKSETQLLVVGLHVKNFNEFLVSLFGTVCSTISLISRFYKGSLSKKALVLINNVVSTKNMSVFIASLKELNLLLQVLISDLNQRLTNLHIYSEKLAEVTEEVFSSYFQLINPEEMLSGLKSIKIQYKLENNVLTIEEKVADNESLLKKQLFIEKAFRLSLLLNSIFVLIERKLNEEFKPLIINSVYNNLEEVGENVSLEDRIEIIRTIIENIVEFLKSIKILSRRHTQILKIITYYAPILVDKLNIKDSVKGRVFSILQLINNYNRHIKDFSILKELNFELIQFNDSIFSSFKGFIKIYVKDSDLREQVEQSLSLETSAQIYSRNFLLWTKKIQLVIDTVSEEFSEQNLLTDLSTKFSQINLDAVQEEILNIFIARQEEEKLVFKRKDLVKKAALDREKSYQEEIASLQDKVRMLEEQVRILQEENQRLRGLPTLERPTLIEEEAKAEPKVIQYKETPDLPKIRISEMIQEKLPTEDIFVKPNLEKITQYSAKITNDALTPAKTAEEVNPEIIEKINPKPIEQDDELSTLPEYDLIKELRKVGQLRFMPNFRETAGNDTDLINEIESLIETQRVIGSATAIRPEHTENEELLDELNVKYKKEPESIFSFNLEEKVVPETTFRFKSPSEIVKFAEKENKPQEKSLDTMKSLKEEIAEYDDQPTPLELKINAYAQELFGEDEEDETKEISKRKSSNGKINPDYDLVNEMESLIDPEKAKLKNENKKDK